MQRLSSKDSCSLLIAKWEQGGRRGDERTTKCHACGCVLNIGRNGRNFRWVLANYLLAETNATVNLSRNRTHTKTHTHRLLRLLPRWLEACCAARAHAITRALVANAWFFSTATDYFHIVPDECTVNMPSVSVEHSMGLDAWDLFWERLTSAYIRTAWQHSCSASEKQMTNFAPLFMELLLTCNSNSLFGSCGPCAQNNS